jgi:hypothetical protein
MLGLAIIPRLSANAHGAEILPQVRNDKFSASATFYSSDARQGLTTIPLLSASAKGIRKRGEDSSAGSHPKGVTRGWGFFMWQAEVRLSYSTTFDFAFALNA